jgi:hypothetical protein
VLRFANIRQKDDKTLTAYLARFERFAHQARVHLDDQDLLRVITLHRGLRQHLRQTLEQSFDNLFDLRYDEYVEQIQRYDRRLPRQSTRQNQKTVDFLDPTDPMDLDPVRANRTTLAPAPARTTSKPPSDPDSSNRSLVRVARATPRPTSPPYKGAKHNKQAERTRLGLCFYCGSLAH